MRAAARSRATVGVTLVLAAVVVLAAAADARAGGDEVIVRLRDGGEVRGELLDLTVEFVKLDPEGAVSLRTIMAEDISAVLVVDTQEVYTYPLRGDEIEGGAFRVGEKRPEGRQIGLSEVALVVQGGACMPNGDYYEGFNAGSGIQGGLYYRFRADGRSSTAFFMGVSYRRSEPGQTSVAYPVDFGATVVFDDADISAIGFEAGVLSPRSENNSHIYALFGLSIVTSSLTGRVVSYDGASSESSTVDDQAAALRLGLGGVIGVTPRVGILLGVGADILLTVDEQQDQYYYDRYERDVLGTVMMFDVGLSVGLN